MIYAGSIPVAPTNGWFMTKKQQKILDADETMISLKERYFRLAKGEKIGTNKEITKTIDNLEAAIRMRQEELLKPTQKKEE